MAELRSRDVVKQIQSGSDLSPPDAPAATLDNKSREGDAGELAVEKENGVHTYSQHTTHFHEQAMEDGSAISESENSRAGSVMDDSKSTETRPVKKFPASKPVSFAKYSVPKTVAANATKVTETKPIATTNAPVPSAQLLGRPRLVAKTTSSLQQKPKVFKPGAPDPMQVWNKNRATPQPSTKHLTDEELKQQYGIHLTSRLQSDGEGKEAKWADIDDDDEDDWAPETIEWGDGTKSTVNPGDSGPVAKSITDSKPSSPALETPPDNTVAQPPRVAKSIGPNATVLKVGASAERQLAQKAAQQPKRPAEKPPLLTSRSSPAPPPVKSPWARLPPVEKVSPVAITSQTVAPLPTTRPSPVAPFAHPAIPSAPSPAKEMSADDFNRSWKQSPNSQPRELFVPNSGRYEAVSENRRRMSKNEQGFRAPAVLQRPGYTDNRAPEPSAAFQTSRTSSDVARRRASSTVSGGSGQLARRMSIRSGEAPPVFAEGPQPQAVNGPPEQVPPPTIPAQSSVYQPRSGDFKGPPTPAAPAGPTDAELEAQRQKQKALMRERIEQARKRKVEEEARLEAEKQERIRQKLASLGPDPKQLAKEKAEVEAKAQAEQAAQGPPQKESTGPVEDTKAILDGPTGVAVPTSTSGSSLKQQSPPKPPQPLATGEPQQYGMMKVHALDTVKKISPPVTQQPQPIKPYGHPPPTQPSMQPNGEETPSAHALVNGTVRSSSESQRATVEKVERSPIPEPIARANRPVSVSAADQARASWGRNDHRSQPTGIGNLWGVPHNRTLGNGTFDRTLAGYAPQDLSSRASSTGQGWMNGKTPTAGQSAGASAVQSPQPHHATQHIDPMSQSAPSLASPEPQPLTVDSEIDSAFPVRPPAPIGPPQVHLTSQPHPHTYPHQQTANGHMSGHNNSAAAAVAGWNHFSNNVRVQDRQESERFERELADRRAEEKQSGVRPQANYNFQETFKQVSLGDQATQRSTHNASAPNVPTSKMFGAVGSIPPAAVNAQVGRGSRFFPTPPNHAIVPADRRAGSEHHVDAIRTPSPPPAEEQGGDHPAYGGQLCVRLPPAKAVVKLPPAAPPTPPPVVPEPVVASAPPSVPTAPQQAMTWAARAAMPAPKPTPKPAGRPMSTSTGQDPSWQARINGLFGKSRESTMIARMQAEDPTLAVASASKEPLDVLLPAACLGSASVSLPHQVTYVLLRAENLATKKVEDEEDLFEDREAGSLPAIGLPGDTPALQWPRPIPSRIAPQAPLVDSVRLADAERLLVPARPSHACIRAPGSAVFIKRDLPVKSGASSLSGRPSNRNSAQFRRGHRGPRGRGGIAKVH